MRGDLPGDLVWRLIRHEAEGQLRKSFARQDSFTTDALEAAADAVHLRSRAGPCAFERGVAGLAKCLRGTGDGEHFLGRLDGVGDDQFLAPRFGDARNRTMATPPVGAPAPIPALRKDTAAASEERAALSAAESAPPVSP